MSKIYKAERRALFQNKTPKRNLHENKLLYFRYERQNTTTTYWQQWRHKIRKIPLPKTNKILTDFVTWSIQTKNYFSILKFNCFSFNEIKSRWKFGFWKIGKINYFLLNYKQKEEIYQFVNSLLGILWCEIFWYLNSGRNYIK